MPGDFTEDIPQLAAEAADIAPRMCGACRNYHSLWPYLRLIGAPGAVANGEALLQSLIVGAMSETRRSLLIAGTADTGLLAIVARAVRGHDADIAVLDRCETPLELCRRFAARRGLSIDTICADLESFSAPPRFDVVVVHSLLPFIPAEHRLGVLCRLRQCLRPDGRLVIRFRTRGPRAPEDDYRNRVPSHLIGRLDHLGIALPEPRPLFRQRIEDYARERHARDVEVRLADVEGLIEAAGFAICTLAPLAPDEAAPFRQLAASASKRRYLAVAAPR
jgi:SAM-dependent methyltransferase